MKIAIQGHPTRGKEVIQILESLGGIKDGLYKGNNPDCYYELHDNTIWCVNTKSINFKYYTLEEFEKEFPFKIGDEVIFPVKTGWASGKVTGLTYVGDQLKYEVDNRIAGYRYIEPRILQLYPMKEERNITLTLDKAKKWYKKGGELKEIALQAFTEKELTKVDLPKTWEEFCEKYPVKGGECWLDSHDRISMCASSYEGNRIFKNWIPSRKSAEAHLAMIQLEQLRDCWRQSWKPIWDISQKYCIYLSHNEVQVRMCTNVARFLTFPTKEMAVEFLECFRDLIEKAGDLI